MSAGIKSEVLAFWFGSPDSRDYGQPHKAWFIKNPAFDQEIRDRFLSTHDQAAAGELDHWQTSAEGCLALLIILDQFSRNLFRDTPRAFAADDKAVAIAQQAIDQGFDQQHLPVQRWFIYLPFEHSENLAHQEQAIALFEALRDDPASASTIQYAYQHHDVIQRFGRFPHRNKILGRDSTAEELEFLKQPGSSF